MTCEAAHYSMGWCLGRGCLTGGIPALDALVFEWVVVTAVVFSFAFCSSVIIHRE